MAKLLIEQRNDHYFVECNERSYERERLEDVLTDTFVADVYPDSHLFAHAYQSEAVRLVSAIFRVLRAERLAVGGEGNWWFAEAEVRRDTPRFVDAECDNPIGALSALIVAIVKEDERLTRQ
jgi:hypothetical protein